jgi:hypothetical protein
LSAGLAWQAAVPLLWAIFTRAPQAVGRFEAQHCVAFIKYFSNCFK